MRLLGGAHRPGTENQQNLLAFIGRSYLLYGDLCAPSNRRIDSPREINEAERSGCMGGFSRPDISRDLESFLSLRKSARRLGTESISLVIFGYV